LIARRCYNLCTVLLIHLVTALRGSRDASTAPDERAWPSSRSSLLELINAAGLPIAQSCRGLGICHSCGVWIREPAARLSPPSDHEHAATLPEGWRLSCQVHAVRPLPADSAHAMTVWHPSGGIARPPEVTRAALPDRVKR
jgi:ferredoxin